MSKPLRTRGGFLWMTRVRWGGRGAFRTVAIGVARRRTVRLPGDVAFTRVELVWRTRPRRWCICVRRRRGLGCRAVSDDERKHFEHSARQPT